MSHEPFSLFHHRTAGSSKAVVLLLLIYCFMGFLCWSLFRYALLYVLFRFAIILTRKRKMVALLLLSFGCLVTVNVLWALPHGAVG